MTSLEGGILMFINYERGEIALKFFLGTAVLSIELQRFGKFADALELSCKIHFFRR